MKPCDFLIGMASNAVFLDGSDIDLQLWEIDENLMRSELSATQMAEHLAKRKELWLARNNVATCTTIRGPGRPPEFASETTKATGVNKSTVSRATARADNTTQEARDMVEGTRLDTLTKKNSSRPNRDGKASER